MHLKIKLLKFFTLLIFVYIPFEVIGAQQDEIIKKEAEVRRHLNRAETWYLMARETFNTLEYHKYAENEYLTAKEKAESLPQPLKDQYTNTAEAGYKQTYWRKTNAWNSFRNIFPSAWWYSGSDHTIDYKDEDHLMLALTKSWEGLEEILSDIATELTPKIIIVPRCNDSEDFDQSTNCGEIKDEFLNTIDLNTSFLGIRDDALATAIGAGWEEFANGGKPSLENIKMLGEFYQADNIVVVDIDVVDEFEYPVVAGRINIQYNQWDSNSMELMSTASENGVVVSLRDRRWITPAWIAFLLVLSFAFSSYQQHKEKTSSKYLLLNFMFFLAGYLMSYFAGMLSDQFIPDWGAMALNTDHYLPLPEMWLWAFVHGVVIMVGPLILCAYFLLQFGNRIPGIDEILKKIDSKNTSMILFTVQAGALGALFPPIIIAWYQEGIILALGLSFAALALSISVAQPFSKIINSKSNVNSLQILSLGILGLLLIIPIGFFRPDWAGYWPIAIAVSQAVIISLVITKLNGKEENEIADKNQGVWKGQKEYICLDDKCGWKNKQQPKDHKCPVCSGEIKEDEVGTIDHPKWVDRDHEIITENEDQKNENTTKELLEKIVKSLVAEAADRKVQTILIGNKNGIGKTRLMHEIFQKVKKEKNPPWKLVWSTAEPPEKDHLAEPYSLISKAFGDAIGISNIADKQAKQARILEVMSSAESALPMGIGSLFDSGDEDHESASKEQITRDMIEAVREQLNKYPLAFFLDDIQWADQDSLELLATMIKKLVKKENQNSLIFVLGSTREEEFGEGKEIIDKIEKLGKVVDLKNFNSGDKITDLLKGSGLEEIPTWFGQALFDHFGGTGTNPEMIIGALHTLTIKKEDGTYKLIDEVNHPELNETNSELIKHKLNEAVPKELLDLIRMRLNELHEEDRIILEAAAEIGRSFSVSLLAAGLEQDRLTLLRSLKRIEDDFHLIVDLEASDDNMSLESQSLRTVLKENSIYSNNKNKRELYKEMHFKIAKKMIEDEDTYVPLQIMKHCVLSGIRLSKEAIDYGIKAIISANNKQSWPTVEFIVEKIEDENTAIIKYANKEQLDQIKFYNALALRGMGQEEKEVSKLFKELLSSDYLNKYELFYNYLINEEKQIWNEKDELDKVLGHFHSLIDLLINHRSAKEDEIIQALCEFYRTLSNNKYEKIHNNKYNSDKYATDLQSLCNKINLIETNADSLKNQERLLSLVYQQLGDSLSKDEDKIMALEKSKELKEELNDVEGLAFCYGGFSNHYYNKKEYELAAVFRAKSFEMEYKRANEAMQSFCLNKLAETLHQWADEDKELKQDEKDKKYNDSLYFAHAAYKIASEDPHNMNMKFNYIFSAINIFNYGKKVGKIRSDLETPQIQRDTKLEIDNGIKINGKIIDIINPIKEMKLEPWDWLKNVRELSKVNKNNIS